MISTGLNQAQFIDRLKKDTLQKGNFETNSKISIGREHVDWNFGVVRNTVFKELVTIYSAELNSGLAFFNCEFKKGIIFRACSTDKFDTLYNPYNCSILFNKCKTEFLTFSEGCLFNRGVAIENESSIGTLSILDSIFTGNAFRISNSEISKLLDVKGANLYSLNISKSRVNNCRIVSSKLDLAFIKSTFQGSVKLWNVDTNKSLTFNQNVFEQEFGIKSSRIESIYIHGDTFQKKAKLENRGDTGTNHESSLDNIYISEANFIEGFEFDGMSKELKNLTLRLSPNFQGILRIIGWKIFETSISGMNENLKVVFKRINFKRLQLIDFSNSGDITFERSGAENTLFKTEEDPDSSIIAYDSSLGLTRFNEFDFNSFDFIDISNVSFNGIEASNVNWFDDSKIRITTPENEAAQGFRRRRELYRQIKHTLKSSGNQIDNLMFQAREMQAYRNELKASGNYNLGDKVIMAISRTNDYGLNWLKPLILLIGITIVCYGISLPLFTKELWYDFDLPFADFSLIKGVFVDNLSTLANMFNPARRFSVTYGENVSTWLYFLDLLHRLFLGIFIFQIIKAFRRLAVK
ncbi:hypothetical protein GCM10023314_30530 [Algibacter agarivorans]|uniref:Pentapeptide repeat-containing protein n=1 Tax=Algibacter agarivorans TaxID=1109741 RepID=A0ABP9GX63_9FLAO